jgi:glycosyltransferase involved in cell wall biosynthesis
VSEARVRKWARAIDGFVYLADRNLTPFEAAGLDRSKFRKMRNAVPINPLPFPRSRNDLGIDASAVVFTLVARGIPGKGWVEAVRAFQALRTAMPGAPMALLAAGDGPETRRAREIADDDPDIHFLGFAREIHGLYRISDVALVPTRYPGESFPLCIIEAMQVGVPVIATDIGEIRHTILTDEHEAGLVVPNLDDDTAYIAAVTERMKDMMDPVIRKARAEDARALGQFFAMDALASDYLDVYREFIKQPA